MLIQTNNKNMRERLDQIGFRPPFGIFGGFTNFKKNRPTDLWTYSFDYIKFVEFLIKN